MDNRLLDPNRAVYLVGRYLTFAQCRGIVRHEGSDRWRVVLPMRPLDAPSGGVGYPAAPLAYAANELAEMLSAA